MTGAGVIAFLSERGVREVARSVLARYHRGELSLDAAARRLATILRAAREWKRQHQPPTGTLWIEDLSGDKAAGWSSFMLQFWARVFTPRQHGGLEPVPPIPLSAFLLAAREVAKTPFVRHPNPEAVYDEAVRINRLVDAARAVHQRWVRAFALYDEVARLMDEAV
jgi:hypothetical protein